MATQVFADEELERLRGFPEIAGTSWPDSSPLIPADLAFVDRDEGPRSGGPPRVGGGAVHVAVAGFRAGHGLRRADGRGGAAGRPALRRPRRAEGLRQASEDPY